MRVRGIITLAVTMALCLPSLLGVSAVFANGLLGRGMADWGRFSSVVVGGGVFLGGDLRAHLSLRHVDKALTPRARGCGCPLMRL